MVRELRRLQNLGLGLQLSRVEWRPGLRADLQGEVVDSTVRIYVSNIQEGLRVLRHEVLHHEIAQCTLPYVQLLNRLLAEVNEEAYRRGERLVERLVDLLHG